MDSNNKTNIDPDTFRLLYQHYKDFLIPVGVIFISVLLFIFFVIPGIQNYFSLVDQAKAESAKLVILQNNLNILSGLDDNALTSDLTTLSTTLPLNKDYVGVINAISTDAVITGVSVGDFSFHVGSLAEIPTNAASYPSLELSINLSGDMNSIIQYISELYKTVPLSEVTSIKITGNLTGIVIYFYSKPFNQSTLSDDKPIAPISSNGLKLISNLSAWNNVGFNPLSTVSLSSTSSAELASESASVGTNSSPF